MKHIVIQFFAILLRKKQVDAAIWVKRLNEYVFKKQNEDKLHMMALCRTYSLLSEKIESIPLTFTLDLQK